MSAIWGFYVESECSGRRKPIVNEPPATAKRAGFPGSVFGFDYQMNPERAAALCTSKGQEWTLEGSTGLCQSKVATVVVPDLRLEFRLGTASEITVVYRSPPNGINQNYTELYAATKKNYGPPQVEPAHVSALCAQSLAECLANGEHPSGPIWQWADGSIELRPIWQEDHALLELHYTHEDAPLK
ncbi:MAG TPA: hypothetical protein VGM44_10190 [Polyangiaceae bacterium]